MNLLNLFKRKKAPAPKPEMPDYERAILRSIETEPNAWHVARHRIHDRDVVKCNHGIKGVLVLVDERESGFEVAESTITGNLTWVRRGHKCWTPNLNFSPEFCERFAPWALERIASSEKNLAEVAREAAIANLRRGLGL